MEDVDEETFTQLWKLASGEEGLHAKDLPQMINLLKLAKRLQMQEVGAVLEGLLLKELTVESCAEILQLSADSENEGLAGVKKESFRMALDFFQEISKTSSFMKLSENVLENLFMESDHTG